MVPFDTVDERESLLRDYGRVIRKWRWLIMAVFSLVVLMAFFDTARVRPSYQATARLLIEMENPDIISLEEAVGQNAVNDPMVSYSSYYQTQYEILRSRSLAYRVIQFLQLSDHAEFAPPKPPPGVSQTILQSPASLLGWLRSQLSQTFGHADKHGRTVPAEPAELDRHAALVDGFLARLEVEPVPDTRLVDIRFTAHDPKLAAQVLNTLSSLYIDQNLQARFSASQDAVDWLSTRARQMRQRVENAELAIQRYKEENDIISLEEHQNIAMQQLAELNSALTRSKADFIAVEALYTEMQRLAQQPDLIESMPSVVNNPLVQNLKESYAVLQRHSTEMELRRGPKHPKMLQLWAQMAAVQEKIRSEIARAIRGIQTDYEVAKARLTALRNAFEQQKQEAQEINKKTIQYGVLKREAEANRQLYDVLLTSMKKNDISAELKRNNIRVIDLAETPRTSVTPDRLSRLARFSALALVLGIGLAFFLEYLNDSLRMPEEAERLLHLPTLGVIGQFKFKHRTGDGKNSRLVTLHHPHSPVSEAFKTLRANLLMSYAEKPRKVFLVTSPRPQDGKTTVAANLAIAMAQMERRVLLIDGDLRRPTLHQVFDLDNGAGLSTLLLQDRYEGVIGQRTLQDNLNLVPAGICPPNPSELLGSQRMQRFIEFVGEHYDIVILDTPPLLVVSDALMASPLVDGIIVVLRSGATTRKQARRMMTQLALLETGQSTNGDREQVRPGTGKVLGLVINGLSPREGSVHFDDHGYFNRAAEETEVVELTHFSTPIASQPTVHATDDPNSHS